MGEESDSPSSTTATGNAIQVVSDKERSDVETLRAAASSLADNTPGKEWLLRCDDTTYLRFLRGHKGNAAVALKYLKGCAKWRAEYGANDIVTTYPQNVDKDTLVLRHFWPLARSGFDLEGRPVHFFNFATCDLPGLLSTVSMEALIRYNVYLAERAYNEYPSGGAVMLIDFPHFHVSDVGKSVKAIALFIRAMAKVVDPYYPESYSKIYMCRPDKILIKLYQSLNLVLSQGTQAKVRMIKEEECLQELRLVMPDEAIPVSLGGSSPREMPPGGKVTAQAIKELEKKALEQGGLAKRLSMAKRVSQRLSISLTPAP